MRRMVRILVLLGVLSACEGDSEARSLFTYEGTKLGNNSDVAAIVNGLEHGTADLEIELQTKKRPYGLTVRYDENHEEKGWPRRNAAKLFILIDNVEEATLQTPDESFSYTKQKLEASAGKRFDDVKTYGEWEEVETWID